MISEEDEEERKRVHGYDRIFIVAGSNYSRGIADGSLNELESTAIIRPKKNQKTVAADTRRAKKVLTAELKKKKKERKEKKKKKRKLAKQGQESRTV